MTRARIALLILIAVGGIILTAPAVVALAMSHTLPTTSRIVLVAFLEIVVLAGTLTWLSPDRPRVERLVGFLFVAGAMTVTLYAGCTAYGWLGAIAPIGYVVSAHLTAASMNRPRTTTSSATAEPPREPQVWGMDEEAPRLPDRPDDVAPDMPELEPATTDDPDGDDTGPLPLDETAQALADYREQHMREHGRAPGKHKARAALGVGWDKLNAADQQLAQRRNGHGAHAMTNG